MSADLFAAIARGFGPMLWQELSWLLEDHSTAEPNTGCLLWTGKVDRQGYGRINWRGLQLLAHRCAFELAHGELPESLEAHHRCEQPSCVNELHLLPVTDEQHKRLHSGRGQLAPSGVDLFAVLADLQKPNAIPYPLSAVARHHGHPVALRGAA